MKITDLVKLNALKFYYKLKHEKVPVYFKNYQVLTQLEIHGRDTRHNNLIPKKLTRTKIQEKCLRQYLPVLLNATEDNIIEKIATHSYNGFSNYVKVCFIQGYKLECESENCYICNR